MTESGHSTVSVPGGHGFSKHFSSNIFGWELPKLMAAHLNLFFQDCTPMSACGDCPSATPHFLQQLLDSLQSSPDPTIAAQAGIFAGQCLDPAAPPRPPVQEDGKQQEPEEDAGLRVPFLEGTIQRAHQLWVDRDSERRAQHVAEKHRRETHCRDQFVTLQEEHEFDGMHHEHGVRKAPTFFTADLKRQQAAATQQGLDMAEAHHAHFGVL